MDVKISHIDVFCATRRTGMPLLLITVTLGMLFQIGFGYERLSTSTTQEWPLASMFWQMSLENRKKTVEFRDIFTINFIYYLYAFFNNFFKVSVSTNMHHVSVVTCRWVFWMNDIGQKPHLKGLSFVWVFACFCIVDEVAKVLPQWMQAWTRCLSSPGGACTVFRWWVMWD